MKIRPKIGDSCLAAANAASGDRLTREQIEEAFQKAFEARERLKAEGVIDGLGERMKSFAEQEAERTRIAARMQRRHAALNILARDRLDKALTSFINAGLTPKQALLATLEGTSAGVENARVSVAALNLGYESKYIGGLFAEIQANRPHVIALLDNQRLDADITREMVELREGGKPGITGNEDAKFVAKTLATYAEMSRTELNRLGASIGKLDGWAGAQTHDEIKMLGAGKEAWTAAILPRLDFKRTFPEATSIKEIEDILSGVYDTIITGFPNKVSAREKGQRVNPANLAKSLGKSRVLHFKDADAAIAYRSEFGMGNTISGIVNHLRSASRAAANMETFGPNPENMLGSVVESLKRKIKEDPKLDDATRQKQIKDLDSASLGHAFDIATGFINRPGSVNGAKIAQDIRAVQAMAKLGGAVVSSISDTVSTGIASMFRGSGFFKGFNAQLAGTMKGRPKGEQAEIAYLLGEGFDGLIGNIVSPVAATDGPVGRLSKLQETFFRWNGLSWWTDVQRGTAAKTIAAEMGMRAKTAFAELPAAYKHVLGLHGIDAPKWEAIRKAEMREVEGKSFITPDRVRLLSDEDVKGLGKTPDDARRELEMALHRFFADETNYGVIETDARSKRTTTWGTRPGTLAGEAIRFVMQFKGFPIAFSQRVWGRAIYGHRPGASRLSKMQHIGALIAGMTMAGYAALTAKDLLRGYWPPRNPLDPKTIAAAFVQGGAAGIYGDYLFGQVSRFGSGILETTAGPTIGTAADAIEAMLKARDALAGKITGDEAKAPYADALNLALGTTPFVNLFYLRPALDYMFLDSLREAVSPGYIKRREKRRKTDYNQTRAEFIPQPLRPFN